MVINEKVFSIRMATLPIHIANLFVQRLIGCTDLIFHTLTHTDKYDNSDTSNLNFKQKMI